MIIFLAPDEEIYNIAIATLSEKHPDIRIEQGLLSAGVLRAHELGCMLDGWTELFRYDLWMQAFRDCGRDPAFYANRPRGLEELRPWDFIDMGVTKRYLRLEYERALKASLRGEKIGEMIGKPIGWSVAGQTRMSRP